MNTIHKIFAIGTMSAILLGGCAGTDPFSNNSSNTYPNNSYPDNRSSSARVTSYGVVDSIDTVRTNSKASGSPIGIGTVIGGVVGGVVGNQVGKGDGKTAATAVGAVGGAIVGHELEKIATITPLITTVSVCGWITEATKTSSKAILAICV